MRENWIKSFAKTGIIELIASKGDVYFYTTRSKDYDGRSPMYHVWDDDKWVYCGEYKQAYRKYTGLTHDY